MIPMWIAPLAGEGTMLWPPTQMGEGFAQDTPHPFHCDSIEPPSPARGEGTTTLTALAALSLRMTQPSPFARPSSLRLFHRANVDLRCERAVHRTFVGDLEQPPPLLRVESAAQGDRPLDAVKHAVLGLAVCAVRGVDAGVIEPDRHPLERQRLALGIEAK